MRRYIILLTDLFLLILTKIFFWAISSIDLVFLKSHREFQLKYLLIKELGSFKFRGQKWVGHTANLRYMTKARFDIERDLVEVIGNYSPVSTSTFWDIGACVGNFSIFAKSKFNNVVVFEPDPLTFPVLIRNIQNSGLNIEVFNLALGNQRFTLEKFYMSSTREGNAHNSISSPTNYAGATFVPKMIQNVVAARADYLITEQNFGMPEFVKIDVDGMELEILEGFGDLLLSQQLKVIVVEVTPENPKYPMIFNLLTRNGFKAQKKFTDKTHNEIFVRVD